MKVYTQLTKVMLSQQVVNLKVISIFLEQQFLAKQDKVLDSPYLPDPVTCVCFFNLGKNKLYLMNVENSKRCMMVQLHWSKYVKCQYNYFQKDVGVGAESLWCHG